MKIDAAKHVGRRQFLKAAAGFLGLAGLGIFAFGERRPRPDQAERGKNVNSGNVSDHTARYFSRGDDLAG